VTALRPVFSHGRYVLVVLHANDNGEGSTFALYSNLCVVLGMQPKGGPVEQQEQKQLLRISRNATLSRSAVKVHCTMNDDVVFKQLNDGTLGQLHTDWAQTSSQFLQVHPLSLMHCLKMCEVT
jgi:hypothetical protein